MPKPPKSSKLLHQCSQTKDEMKHRELIEDALIVNCDRPKPSNRLNSNQKKIFNFIADGLADTKIIGHLDPFSLETLCIAIDRLQVIEKEINRDFSNIYNKELMSAKSKYTADLLKFGQEFCLTPQARAKMGIISLNKALEDSDPLLKVLKKVN